MASPYDLTTLAAVKAWLSIANTNSDALLAPTITAASRWVLSYLGRGSVLPATFNERYDGQGNKRLYLRNWPVISVSSLLVNGQTVAAALPPSTNNPTPSGYLLAPWDGRPPGELQALDVFGSEFSTFSPDYFPYGRQNVAVTYVAGYGMQGEAQSVPTSPGPYALTAIAPYGPWANDLGVTYANGTALTAVTGTPAVGQYSVAGGVYTFAAADAGAAVLLSYGFVPQDLAQATMELVSERFKYRDRVGEASKTLSGQETTAFSLKDMPDAMKLMLQPYRAVVVPA